MTDIKLNRRQFTLTLAGAAVGASMPQISFAGELATVTLGDIQVSSLSDGSIAIPTSWFPDANEAERASVGEAIGIGVNQWLIRSGDKVVLVDTGAGPLFEGVGQLDALLAANGIAAADITDIIITHMHSDHIGGFARPEAGGFDNAVIHMSSTEWGFWNDPAFRENAPEEVKQMIDGQLSIMTPLIDRVQLHDGEAEIAAGVTLVPLPGHTPGHTGVRIGSGDQVITLVADAILSEALQFANPQLTYVLDIDPQLAVATRVDLLNQLADNGQLFAATHLEYPGIGRVERDGDGFRFAPALS